MSIIELKEELHHFIDNADETFLKMIYAISKEYKKTAIVGYNVDGTPISQDDLKNRVKAASKRVKSGDYISQEEMEEEVKDW